MYQFAMTDEEVRRTRAAVRLVAKVAKGQQLHDSLEIGDVLLKGRAHAMKAAETNKPNGKAYAEAFRQWKSGYGWPTGKENEALYDAAIVCAAHRDIAEEVIASLDIRKRVELGIFGLAVRVRDKVRELEGLPRKARRPQRKTKNEIDGLRGEVSDVKEELTAARAENPFAYWRTSPVEVGKILLRADPKAAETLARTILAKGGE